MLNNEIPNKERLPEAIVIPGKENPTIDNNLSNINEESKEKALVNTLENKNPDKAVIPENTVSNELKQKISEGTKKDTTDTTLIVDTQKKINHQANAPLEVKKVNDDKSNIIEKVEQKKEIEVAKVQINEVENKSLIENPFLANSNSYWKVGDSITFGVSKKDMNNYNEAMNNPNQLINPFIQNHSTQNNSSNLNEWNKGICNNQDLHNNQSMHSNPNPFSDNSIHPNAFSNNHNQDHSPNLNPFLMNNPGNPATSNFNNSIYNAGTSNSFSPNINPANPFFSGNTSNSSNDASQQSNSNFNFSGSSNFSMGTISRNQNNNTKSNSQGGLFAYKVSKFDF